MTSDKKDEFDPGSYEIDRTAIDDKLEGEEARLKIEQGKEPYTTLDCFKEFAMYDLNRCKICEDPECIRILIRGGYITPKVKGQ